VYFVTSTNAMDGLEIKLVKALATLKKELSELLMVSARAVQTWEDGSRNISPSTLLPLQKLQQRQQHSV
jgi:DNA-binding transcriptional regulator YiaG